MRGPDLNFCRKPAIIIMNSAQAEYINAGFPPHPFFIVRSKVYSADLISHAVEQSPIPDTAEQSDLRPNPSLYTANGEVQHLSFGKYFLHRQTPHLDD